MADQQHGIREAKAKKRRSPRKLEKISVEHAKNGGHVVTHHYTRKAPDGYPGYEQPEQHVFGADQGAEMLAHVGRHMGVEQEEPEEGAEGEESGDQED